jgi:spermidine synthase
LADQLAAANRLDPHHRFRSVVQEGTTTTVSVHTQRETRWTVPLTPESFTQRLVPAPTGTRHLCVSGQHIASDEAGQRAWQTFHGHSAMLLHGAAQRVLGIGYGTGETMASLSRHRPAILDCVEISPEVVDAARRFFGHLNADETARVIIADGRNHLHLSPCRYDLILSDPINPLYGENGSLYTREFFTLARGRLEPGGLFLCWLPLHLPAAVLESILATVIDVFPCVTIWTMPIAGGTFAQLVCSMQEQRYSPGKIESLLSPAVSGDLARIGIAGSAEMLAYYRGDQRHIAGCLQRPRLNSDYRPVVEFNTSPAEYRLTAALILRLLAPQGRSSLPARLTWHGIGPAEQAEWMNRWETAQRNIIP